MSEANELTPLLYVLIGAAGWPAWHLMKFLFRVTYVAVYDTAKAAKHGELKDGYYWYDWGWILPKIFFQSWRETAWDDLRGWRRSL